MPFITATQLDPQSALKEAVSQHYHQDETDAVQALLSEMQVDEKTLKRIESRAKAYIQHVREVENSKGGIDGLMREYDLSSEEGIALMCLAESLLRIPDNATMDKLIKDKIVNGNWKLHQGNSNSMFVNAATWGLILTGKVLSPSETQEKKYKNSLQKFVSRRGEPVIRQALKQAMKVLGKQFVLGETVSEALKRTQQYDARYCYSFDMLGEAAKTEEDALLYFDAYKNAITEIAKAKHDSIYTGNGISIKLSALHPRYEFSKPDAVMTKLLSRVKALVMLAKEANIHLTIDAEEADRLEISLDILEALMQDSSFAGWQGLGLAVQAYQKRAPYVIDYLAALAKQYNRRLMVRLVKGAYWDSEIKNAQVNGYDDYPVYTRKLSTDVSYLVCAKKLLAEKELFYPQFATHNAYTLASIIELAEGEPLEFQRLHGMGESLYDHLLAHEADKVHVRVYAPVGGHKHLLAYLVRRLLENGANTSFVNRIIDKAEPIEKLIQDPVKLLQEKSHLPNPGIRLPKDIYDKGRQNAKGVDLSCRQVQRQLQQDMQATEHQTWQIESLVTCPQHQSETVKITEPSSRDQEISDVTYFDKAGCKDILSDSLAAFEKWHQAPLDNRCEMLLNAADLLEARMPFFLSLLVREAGKTLPNAISEVREAIDFLRYYADNANSSLKPMTLTGPTGERNELFFEGRGVVVCISPWNFPLAIFIGQVAAALVTGNTVIAKPAEQTPTIAYHAVKLLHEAGVPEAVCQCVFGLGETVGQALVSSPDIAGVMFTGSTETARAINITLANRDAPIIPFIAETGGQNCMIVDSSALLEQVITDVVMSAFDSSGQRCSALRVVFVQEDIYADFTKMLQGAMAELSIGYPGLLATDIGPVIDMDAWRHLEDHKQTMKSKARLLAEVKLPESASNGFFVAPAAFEIESLAVLNREVFGPILHVIRYQEKNLNKVIDSINNTGYGLTFGIHSRVESEADTIVSKIKAGNNYINRDMVGAVVGVQPFGGRGLSGTGPKAGGPHYLQRLVTEKTITKNITAFGGNATLLSLDDNA